MPAFSYQLYSSRNNPPINATLDVLSAAGYAQVEGYGGLFADGTDASALAASLAAKNLHMASCHLGLDMVEGDPTGVLKLAQQLNIEAIFVPFIMPDDRPTDAAGWKAFGARLEQMGAPLRAAGLQFGYHNHDFEFAALPDGTIPMDHILAGGPSLAWEADIAWIMRGGADPFAWLKSYAPRIIAAHLKDIAPAGECEDEDGWADVGHGTMDWPGLMTALSETACRYFVMEHDNPSDDTRFARRAIAAANDFGKETA